jgi:cystathionine gamma-lyase / homocysteine desulfhydrase
MKDQTSILHAIPVDELTGSISTPIYQTATFVQESPGINKGFDYARTANPTRKVLENLIAKLEHGCAGFAFASGLAAIDAVVKLLRTGDEIVAVDDIYGGAFRLFTHVYEKFGITVRYTDTTDIAKLSEAITPRTRLIWLETPTNPTLKVSDISAIAGIARYHGALLCVDNTFASPVSQNPILLGADIVVHSATKYLAGHSDLIGGLVVTRSEEIADRIKFIQNASGAILGPFDSWLVIRGIETLPVRIRQHSAGALQVATFLETHELVGRVCYPGLPSHPQHQLAKKQLKYSGGIVSFDLRSDDPLEARRIVSSTRYFRLAESLGGVKSLVCLPPEMTHKSIPVEKRKRAGITDSFIRLSVGLEDAEDLIEDLSAVLACLKPRELFTA